MLLAIIFAGAQGEDAFSPQNTVLLQQIKQRAMADLANVPNYVCVDSIERPCGYRASASSGALTDYIWSLLT